MFRSLFTRGLALLFLSARRPPPARRRRSCLTNRRANLSTLGRKPDWSELEHYQATITHDEFVQPARACLLPRTATTRS